MMNCALPIARGTLGPTARACGRGGAGIFRSQHTLETGGREEGRGHSANTGAGPRHILTCIHSYTRPCVVAENEICQEIPVFASVLCLNLPWPNGLISIRRWVVTLKTPTSAPSPAGRLVRKLASTAATTEPWLGLELTCRWIWST